MVAKTLEDLIFTFSAKGLPPLFNQTTSACCTIRAPLVPPPTGFFEVNSRIYTTDFLLFGSSRYCLSPQNPLSESAVGFANALRAGPGMPLR